MTADDGCAVAVLDLPGRHAEELARCRVPSHDLAVHRNEESRVRAITDNPRRNRHHVVGLHGRSLTGHQPRATVHPTPHFQAFRLPRGTQREVAFPLRTVAALEEVGPPLVGRTIISVTSS